MRSYTYGGTSGGPNTATNKENIDPEELYDKIFGQSSEIWSDFLIASADYNGCTHAFYSERGGDFEEEESEIAGSYDGHEAGREYQLKLVSKHIYFILSRMRPQ